MRIEHLDEGVGRIVKGVNTTPDVGVDQTRIEAAKFGNKVDKDGRPPTLSSKVKGKSTNVLFNLGLTEGIKLRLERDKHMDVLHIQDTKEKHRVEVRGKKDYESGGYDPKDKLHQVLDRVGKAANISDLMNGEVVHINPGHPQGSRAIRTARDVLKTEGAPRYTAAEWAIIEGGHSLEDVKPQPKKPGRIFSALVEDVEIDNKDGWGAVPWNQEIDYRGLRVKMKPSVFINLAASRNGEPPVPKVVDYVKGGGAIGAPFLQIFVDEDDSQIPEVRGHEGRSRMAAILEVHGDVPVETHLFFQGKVNRNRHITPEFVEKIQRYLISENDKMVRGPLFEI